MLVSVLYLELGSAVMIYFHVHKFVTVKGLKNKERKGTFTGKIVPVLDMKAYWWISGASPFILNLGT